MYYNTTLDELEIKKSATCRGPVPVAKSAGDPIAVFSPSAEKVATKNGGEVYFYADGGRKMRREFGRKERFSRERENGREKFPSSAAPDLR